LIMACINGNLEEVKKIIENDSHSLEEIIDGWSLLHIAVINNKLEIIKLLLDYGKMNINIKNPKNGYTPIYLACQMGYKMILEELIKHQADINSITNDGYTPIEIACSNDYCNIVECLLNEGANKTINTEKEYKLLHIAVENNNISLVKLLLKNNQININIKDSSNWTALHIASRDNYYDIAQYLIRDYHAD
ncbi:ankyrin, partial [Anaeromyces robustus]